MALRLPLEHSSRTAHAVGQSRLEGPWRDPWLVAECVSAVLVRSVVLACARQAEPSWIPGIHDPLGDDDAVGMSTDGPCLSDSSTPRVESVGAMFVLGRSTAGLDSACV